MAEITTVTQVCDVCGRSIVERWLPYNWSKYYYGKSWSSGSHSGTHNMSFIACDKCVGTKSLFKKLLGLIRAEA